MPLAPSGPWQVDFAANRCALTREFGTGEDKVSLGLMPLTGHPQIGLVLLAEKGRLVGEGRASVLIDGDDGGRDERHLYFASPGAAGGSQALIRWHRARMDKLAKAQMLTVRAPGRTLPLQVRGIGKALATLADCETNLQKSWGFDPDLVDKPAKILNGSEAMDFRDYSRDALENGVGGQTAVRIAISPEGKPGECVVVESVGHAELDQTVCERMTARGKFQAASDKDGKPVRGLLVLSIVWQTSERY